MQRTLAVVLIPSLVVVTLCILAMEPGRKPSSTEDGRNSAIFDPGDTAWVSGDGTALKRGEKTLAVLAKDTEFHVQQIKNPWIGGNTKVGGQRVSGWIHQRDLTNKMRAPGTVAGKRPGSSDNEPAEALAGTVGKQTAVDGPQESMGRTFARLMASERSRKSTDVSDSGGAPDDLKNKPTTSQTSSPEPPALEESHGRQDTGRSPVSDRKRLISALPIIVARSSSDLVGLDASQTIGQLTVTGDHFTNRSLKYLDGLRILSISVEAVHIGNAGLVQVANVKELKELRLWTPGVTSDGLASLAELDGLELLDLEGTRVRGIGLLPNARFPHLTQLTLGPQTEDEDLVPLASLPSLVELDLRSCRRLSDACLKLLAQPNQLKMIWLPSQVGKTDKQLALDTLPNCQLRW